MSENLAKFEEWLTKVEPDTIEAMDYRLGASFSNLDPRDGLTPRRAELIEQLNAIQREYERRGF